ncbi:MAG TPA: urea ABC transporter permease subunit UrtC [bacterium]|nr:urea ABC transporter permease subunit UrtC [bacterium]
MTENLKATLDRALPWSFLFLFLVLVPLFDVAGWMSPETINQWGRFGCFAIAALGLDLLWGYTGLLGLCQSFFFTLGAYAMGMYLAMHGPLDGPGIPRCLYVVSSDVSGFNLPWFWKPFGSFPVAVLLGLLLPGLAAFIIGYSTFRSRVRGVYFSILTQAITLGGWLVFCRNSIRLCGTNGLTNFVTLAGFDLSKGSVQLGLYMATVVVLALAYVGCRWLVGSRLGRVLLAIRDKESRLRFSGYRPTSYKVFIFVVAAMLAGLGGMLYTPQMGIMTPTHMTVESSILMVVWVAVGGRGTLSGAILGALLVNSLYSFLTTRWPHSWLFVEGGLFISVVLFFPEGLMSLWRKWMVRKEVDLSVPVELAPAAEPKE